VPVDCISYPFRHFAPPFLFRDYEDVARSLFALPRRLGSLMKTVDEQADAAELAIARTPADLLNLSHKGRYFHRQRYPYFPLTCYLPIRSSFANRERLAGINRGRVE